jgi:uncharacterized membrane protein
MEPMTCRTLRSISLILFLFFLATLPATARELVIQHFDVQIQIKPDSSIEVAEMIDVQFIGAWHGIYRNIPIEYTTPEGFTKSLFLKPLGVTDDNGNPLKYDTSRQGAYERFTIYVPDAVDATRSVVIRYSVPNSLGFFQDHDELYWNLTGNEWDAPIQHASGHITLPQGTTGIRSLAFTGAYGSREQNANVSTNNNVVDVQTTQPLGFHEGLTIVVGWDKGFVHEPGTLAQIVLFLRSNWPFGIPILVFFAMFWLWWTRGRDPKRESIAVQYEPPDKLTPGECGTLVDDEVAMRDITATLVDLAVKGYIVIEQKDESRMLGLSHHKDYIFHLKKASSEWGAARPHEQQMLAALFEEGRPDVSLSELQNRFYTNLPGIRDSVFDALMSDGYYLHRPDRVRQTDIGAGITIGIVMVVFGTGIAQSLGMAPLTWILTGIATGAIICIFGWFMPARTITGERALEKVLGFEDFLAHVESDRIQRIVKTPEMFEKFLPYAMALQVDKKWARAFENIGMQPPQWFQGGYGMGFQPYLLMADLDMMSMQTGMAMASAPRSVGGSGFGGGGGGGYSGGGMGGGGGGGF